jgi:dTDP-4-dehydrorhamnose reductase
VAKIARQLRQGEQIELHSPDIRGTPTYVPALAAEILRMVKNEYEGITHVAGGPCVSRLEFARQIASLFLFDPESILPVYGRPIASAPRPSLAGLVCDHDGYRPINGHGYKDGLLELSKTKGIYDERPMERVEAGRSDIDQ